MDIICDGCEATIFNDYFYVITGFINLDNYIREYTTEYYFCPQCMDKVYVDYKNICLGRYDNRFLEINHRYAAKEAKK